MKNKMTAPVWALLLMLCPVLFLPITKLLFPLVDLYMPVYLLFSIGAVLAGSYFFKRKKQAQKMNRLYDEFNNNELVEYSRDLDDGNLGRLLLVCLFYFIGIAYLYILLGTHYKKQSNDNIIGAVLFVIAFILVIIGWIRMYGSDPYEYTFVGFIKKHWLVPEYPDKEDVECFIIVTKGEKDPNEEKIKSLELKRLREEIQSTLEEDIVTCSKRQEEELQQKEKEEERETQKRVKEEERRQEILRLVNMS